MKKQKNKIIKRYKELIENKDSHISTVGRFDVVCLGTAITTYVDGIYQNRKTPEIVSLTETYVQLDSEIIKLDYNLHKKKTSEKIEKEIIKQESFFRIFKKKNVVVNKYIYETDSADFTISYGEVNEKITKNEYFDLVELATKEFKKRVYIKKNKKKEIQKKRRIIDQKKLDEL